MANTLAVGPVTEYPSRHLFALAMVYVTPVRALNETFAVLCWPANTSKWQASIASTVSTTSISSIITTSSSSSPSSTSHAFTTNSSALSPGAAAGIGIGTAAGALLIAFLAWLMYRRRKSSKTDVPISVRGVGTPKTIDVVGSSELGGYQPVFELHDLAGIPISELASS